MKLKSDIKVDPVFNAYPEFVKQQMLALRELVIETASEIPDIEELEETLKWGEPSYRTKKGSTIRMDWKAKTPDQYALYFKCTSKLVPSFKLAFNDKFSFEGTRAIVFQLDEQIPKTELKECIKAALTYHKIKHLPLLGLGSK